MLKKENDFLFASPSLWEGIARLLDIGSTLTTSNDDILTPEEQDRLAMKSDWNMVAYDLQCALNEYANEFRISREKG